MSPQGPAQRPQSCLRRAALSSCERRTAETEAFHLHASAQTSRSQIACTSIHWPVNKPDICQTYLLLHLPYTVTTLYQTVPIIFPDLLILYHTLPYTVLMVFHDLVPYLTSYHTLSYLPYIVPTSYGTVPTLYRTHLVPYDTVPTLYKNLASMQSKS